MEVTRANFKETLPTVQKAIEQCHFMSIDAEFTGLNNRSARTIYFDSAEERYNKLMRNGKDFIILQFGLCTFHYNTEDKQYTTKAFNFYVFPFVSQDVRVPDRIFQMQSSSIDFLCSQGFDFNKAFSRGIPYLKKREAERLCKTLTDKKTRMEEEAKNSGNSPNKIKIELKGKLKNYIENQIAQVKKFISNKEQTEYVFKGVSSFWRKALHEQIPSNFEGQVYLETRKVNGRVCLVCLKGNKKDNLKERNEETHKKDMEAFDTATGFSKVIQMITNEGKLVIGHNMMLDVLYTTRQFVQDLPEELTEFKQLVKQVLPGGCIDTKLMSSLFPFKEKIEYNPLSDMYATLKNPGKFTQINLVEPEEYKQIDNAQHEQNLHQAAYDAFITGYSFLIMYRHLNGLAHSNNDVNPEGVIPNESNIVTNEVPILKPYINLINLSHCYEIPYMDVQKPEPEVAYDDVIVARFPSEWNTKQVSKHFSPYLVHVNWIDDSSAYIRFQDKEKAKQGREVSFKKNSDVTNKCKVMSVESHRCAQRYGGNDVTKTNDVTTGKKRSADGDNASGEAKKVKTEPETKPENGDAKTDGKKSEEKKEFEVSSSWD